MGDLLLRKLLITSALSPNLSRQSDNRLMEPALQVLAVLAALEETSALQELLFWRPKRLLCTAMMNRTLPQWHLTRHANVNNR
jgi:hypothetical protein